MNGLEWHLADWAQLDWNALDRLPDRTVFQTRAWLEFVAETQDGKPVVAELRDGQRTVAYFSGVIVKRFGVRIFGSPFPGWTTPFMGFNAESDEMRKCALDALPTLAFRELGCMHVEFMDHRISLDSIDRSRYTVYAKETQFADLTKDEDAMFAGMTGACRRCIRKAEKCGVRIVEVPQDGDLEEFAAEYYSQVNEVFLHSGLVCTYDLNRVRALLRHLRGTGNLLLLRALDANGACIASAIYMGLNDLAHYWGNGSRIGERIVRPNEALHWYALRYWKARGAKTYNWGAGEYKRKYGVVPVQIPFVRRSRYPALEQMRGLAKMFFAARQRVEGAIQV